MANLVILLIIFPGKLKKLESKLVTVLQKRKAVRRLASQVKEKKECEKRKCKKTRITVHKKGSIEFYACAKNLSPNCFQFSRWKNVEFL